MSDQRAGQRDALLFAAGQFRGTTREQVAAPDQLGCLPHPGADLASLHLPRHEPEADVVPDVQVREQGVALEHHRDVPLDR